MEYRKGEFAVSSCIVLLTACSRCAEPLRLLTHTHTHQTHTHTQAQRLSPPICAAAAALRVQQHLSADLHPLLSDSLPNNTIKSNIRKQEKEIKATSFLFRGKSISYD
ncbi:hypothetical protein AMECASPLE_031866 [Ameca splendens]|uniref:C2H2-type domain-containing protein n=1 Tax=Ameca splendens TaxID=208324 RepID=A0ABV0YHG8_9TELE